MSCEPRRPEHPEPIADFHAIRAAGGFAAKTGRKRKLLIDGFVAISS